MAFAQQTSVGHVSQEIELDHQAQNGKEDAMPASGTPGLGRCTEANGWLRRAMLVGTHVA